MTNPSAPNATLISRTNISATHAIIRVKPDWPIPNFLPGQFTALGLFDDFIKRSYSITSGPAEKGYLEFYLNYVEGGQFTTRLFALEEQARVWMNPRIEGQLTLNQVPPEAPLYLLATSTGLGPFMSMLRSGLLKRQHKAVTLVHSVRHPEELAFQNELRQLETKHANFHYVPTVTRTNESLAPWSGHVNRIPSLWEQVAQAQATTVPNQNKTHVFLCGNPEMIRDMLALLEAQGFERFHPRRGGNVHVEKYW